MFDFVVFIAFLFNVLRHLYCNSQSRYMSTAFFIAFRLPFMLSNLLISCNKSLSRDCSPVSRSSWSGFMLFGPGSSRFLLMMVFILSTLALNKPQSFLSFGHTFDIYVVVIFGVVHQCIGLRLVFYLQIAVFRRVRHFDRFFFCYIFHYIR